MGDGYWIATHLVSHYNGFNYEKFCVLTIDFPKWTRHRKERLPREVYNQRNRYVSQDPRSAFTATNTSPGERSRGPLLCE